MDPAGYLKAHHDAELILALAIATHEAHSDGGRVIVSAFVEAALLRASWTSFPVVVPTNRGCVLQPLLHGEHQRETGLLDGAALSSVPALRLPRGRGSLRELGRGGRRESGQPDRFSNDSADGASSRGTGSTRDLVNTDDVRLRHCPSSGGLPVRTRLAATRSIGESRLNLPDSTTAVRRYRCGSRRRNCLCSSRSRRSPPWRR